MRIEIVEIDSDKQKILALDGAGASDDESGVENLCDLLENPRPSGFNPKTILWCRYSIGMSTVNGKLQIEIKNEIYEYPLYTTNHAQEMVVFAKSVAGGRPPDHDNLWHWPTMPSGSKPHKPSDIGVNQQCYVLLQLLATNDWKFRVSRAAITTDSKNLASNFDLMHVIATKDPVYGDYPPGCEVAYFSVVHRKSYEIQKFNFHVDLVDTEGAQNFHVGIIIDPDIRNTGDPVIPYP